MNIITLTEDKDLRIYMHPTRQLILHQLSTKGPMTAKMIATDLAITPSSAKHHLLKLGEIKVVEIDHQELIHGITATYYRQVRGTVSLGSTSVENRRVVSQNLIKQVLDRFYSKERNFSDEEGHFAADQLSGVVHLRAEEADQLYHLIRDFLSAHEEKTEGTIPFSYALVACRA